ncbi:hypothetical protein pEaSNUABM40_00198 [Erwinia phage pEa_SNUABM_40]|uniref:Uncharacterized protein n=1 Tax=Erwinia phage pEa_SNUABM_3 TaxID=2869552 RepID=A0AAE7XHX8_9CAUD|nr:hypothetical protein MPK68_gp195 [Erwinia phage pEa_SNUABM_3]QZE56392.1 hypothetical protein pEaSNUABM3_00195 [Erwinia phage pEa_SNUABM_3]QZE58414.1 hypothetical protein pEaSNUABM40_00198 [Erwinia phage pEa_SNUABM_40]UAW52976.1 hypothetical protein pEaSNUABM23_00194 [Erwinia phage pEa_SNUABM_23]UIW10872.1 hypothetical protein pEaSNUABM23_00194 [Erwinia phage pEa_SNUABM_31]
MEIYVSLSKATQITAQALQSVVGFRVLDHRLLREDDGFAFYAFVTFMRDDSGDYELKIAKLIRKGLTTHSFKLSGLTTVSEGYQSIYDAAMAMERLNANGKFISLSAPPPIQSLVFQLSDFKIQMTPELQDRVDTWCKVQTICPLRYAVVNPRTDAIEVAFKDPSAHNSDIIGQMLRNSLYQALGDYAAGKNFDLPGHALI